jgi:hypothetical protein
MENLLKELPNGGAVVAIIVVVMVFLKRSDKHDDAMKGIVTTFVSEVQAARKDYTAELAASRREYLDSLAKITAPKGPR